MNSQKRKPRDPAKPANQPSETNIPGKKNVEYEKRSKRSVNEDEQQKVLNTVEDNAQSPAPSNEDVSNTEASENREEENSNERLEAPDDQNEIDPRSPSVN